MNSVIKMLSPAKAAALRITNEPGCTPMLMLFEYFCESQATGNIDCTEVIFAPSEVFCPLGRWRSQMEIQNGLILHSI
jgi:hypothetical protein